MRHKETISACCVGTFNLNGQLRGVLSKLDTKYSSMCEVLKLQLATFTIGKFNYLKRFTASNVAVRFSSLSTLNVQLHCTFAKARRQS